MRLQIDILRRESVCAAPCLQRFLYEWSDEAETVATALTRLNEAPDLRDMDGKPASPIRWECSCLQKKCGACAMVVNGVPRLACDARLTGYRNKIRLEPLRKFPVVADLIVDRSVLFDNLKELRLWLDQLLEPDGSGADPAYEASRCLQCGCCLDVCPNFYPGGAFAGMSAAVPVSRLLALLPPSRLDELSRRYRRRVYEGCGKSLSCRNICPAGIDIEGLLINSNAVAVWKYFFKG